MIGKASLLYVLGFSVLLGYMNYNLNRQATQVSDLSAIYHDHETAHNLAVAGAHLAMAKLLQDTTWTGPVTHTTADIPGSYRVERVGKEITSVATFSTVHGGTIRDTIVVLLGQRMLTSNSFTVFAWMTNNERGVYWITGDTVFGKFHTNTKMNISGSPVFTGHVSTASTFNYTPGKGTNKAKFLGGYTTRAERIQFPSNLNPVFANAGAYSYGTEIWLTLDRGTAADGDGMALVRTSAGGPVIDTIRFAGNPSYTGVIAGNGRVHIEGVLDGQLTIASRTDILVEDDVLYEQDPRGGTSDDLLGIVADNNVIVTDNPNNWSSCTIQGNIFARRGSLLVENHTSTTSGSAGKRGTLYLLGSVVQNNRGAVARQSNGILQTGYFKSYTYDDRLTNPLVRPPHYPGYYSWTIPITGWWESYPRYNLADLAL